MGVEGKLVLTVAGTVLAATIVASGTFIFSSAQQTKTNEEMIAQLRIDYNRIEERLGEVEDWQDWWPANGELRMDVQQNASIRQLESSVESLRNLYDRLADVVTQLRITGGRGQ